LRGPSCYCWASGSIVCTAAGEITRTLAVTTTVTVIPTAPPTTTKATPTRTTTTPGTLTTAPAAASERGILGIAAFAFALGFAHEEEFEIIALCLGSDFCLELMLVYALAVIAALVAFTVLLIAGYEQYEERVRAYTPYLPAFSAAVLIGMGVGFLLELF
jgi:hypothetical protein